MGMHFYLNKNVIFKLSGTLTFTNVGLSTSSGTYAYAWAVQETNTSSIDYNEFISIPDFDSNSHYYHIRYLAKNSSYSYLGTSDLSSYKEVTLSLTNCTCPYQKVLVNDITKTEIYYNDGKDKLIIENGYLDIGIIDTMKDLFVNLIGAVVFSIFGLLYIKDRDDHQWIERFIVRLKELK